MRPLIHSFPIVYYFGGIFIIHTIFATKEKKINFDFVLLFE